MLSLAFLRWWYGAGWLTLLRHLKRIIARVLADFSVGLLLKTLFKPWKQIISGQNPNATIGYKLRAAIDNLISRVVGAAVRILTFGLAMASALGLGIISGICLMAWPLAPPAVVWLLWLEIGLSL